MYQFRKRSKLRGIIFNSKCVSKGNKDGKIVKYKVTKWTSKNGIMLHLVNTLHYGYIIRNKQFANVKNVRSINILLNNHLYNHVYQDDKIYKIEGKLVTDKQFKKESKLIDHNCIVCKEVINIPIDIKISRNNLFCNNCINKKNLYSSKELILELNEVYIKIRKLTQSINSKIEHYKLNNIKNQINKENPD